MKGLGVVLSLEGGVQSAKVLQCGECLGCQAFYEYLLPGAGLWVGAWVGSIVQIYTMKLANSPVSEVTLVSGIIKYPGTKRGYWWVIAWGDHLATQSEVHRSAPSTASSSSLLEMQILGLTPDLLYQNSQVICMHNRVWEVLVYTYWLQYFTQFNV